MSLRVSENPFPSGQKNSMGPPKPTCLGWFYGKKPWLLGGRNLSFSWFWGLMVPVIPKNLNSSGILGGIRSLFTTNLE